MYASSKGACKKLFQKHGKRMGGKIRSNVVVPVFMDAAMSATLSDEQKIEFIKEPL